MLMYAKQHLLNTLSLSVISLLLGYGLWHCTSQSHKIEATFSVPVSFYNTENKTIQAPDQARVKLYGSRKELYKVLTNLAIHVDAQTFSEGKIEHTLTKKDLFLPESIVLLNYLPTTLLITVHKS